MDESILVPIASFVMIVLVVWLFQAHSSRNRAAFLETVRAAIERGVELSPELIKTMGAPRASKYADIKWGVIWIAVALACLTLGWSISMTETDPEDAAEGIQIMIGLAAFPGFVGLALLGYGIAMRKLER